MSVGGILKGVVKSLVNLMDSDHDGKLEIADVPGAIANIASMRTQGEALVAASKALFDGIRSAANTGNVTSGGAEVTAEQVDAAWDQSYVPYKTAYKTAADEARAAELPGQSER
jgi:hypothetical protein